MIFKEIETLCVLQPQTDIATLIHESYRKFGLLKNQEIEKMRLNQRLRVVQGLEDSARRTIVRSLAAEIPFAASELEELYSLFKVSL